MGWKRWKKFKKKALKFEKEHTRNLWRGIKDDPKRLVLGVDPFSTKMWNKALGRDDRALVNQLGGATSYDYQVALEKGIDIGPGKAMHDIAGVVAGAYAGGALGQAAGTGAGAIPGVTVTPATQTAITAGTQMAVPAATAALEDPIEVEEEETIGLGGLGGLRVYNVPTYRRAEGGRVPSKSPKQAKLMRAVAHGWKPSRMKGPSRAVAQEFVEADKKYSGGFAENRYWTGGLAAMDEVNSGVPATLKFQKGGKPKGYQFGGLAMSEAQRQALQQRYAGYQQPQATSQPTSEELHRWYSLNPGKPYPGAGTATGTATATAPATTGIGTPYVGYGGYGGYGGYTPPATTAAPVAPTGTTIASMYGDRYTETQPIAGAAVLPYLQENATVMGNDPVDMSGHKQSGPYGAMFTKAMENGLRDRGYIEDPATRIWYPWQPITDGGGTGGGTTAPPPARDIPGAGPQPGAPATPPATTTPTTPPQWTPEQIARWEAQQTSASRQSTYRDQLKAHKGRVASALNPGPMPAPASVGGGGGGGMMYPGGTPGFYAPGGPGRGGQLDLAGNYTDKTGYDSRDFSDAAVAARREAEQAYLDESGYEQPWMTAGAKGGYMNYQEGGTVPKPPTGGGAPIPGHMEGANPYAPNTARHRMWERKYHVAPPPPPPPPPPAEEPGFFSSLFGFGAAEEGKSRTERELERYGEGMSEARGGHVRRFQGGGLARVAPPAGGVPPWVEPAGYMEPEGYQIGGMARQMFDQQKQRAALGRGAPPRSGGLGQMAQQQQRTLGRAGGAGRWSPQQQQAWRGARGNPAARSAMRQQSQQRQAMQNRAPQQAGRAGMMADYQRAQAAQRGLQPGSGGTRDFLFEGQPQQPQSIADRIGGNRFGEDYRVATGRQTYQDVVNRGGGGINPRLPGGGRMYGSAPQPGMAYAGGTPGYYGPGGPGRGPSVGGGEGIPGGPRVPPNMRGFLQKQRMMNRPPSNVGGGVNRVGQQDQQGAQARAMQRGTGRRPMSRRGGFPGRRGVR